MDYRNGYKETIKARERIRDYIYETPLVRLNHISEMLGTSVYAKLENMQKTNSFKIRGALNKIRKLSDEELKKGVVTASSGNHGKGIATCAKILGIPAKIVLPDTSTETKRQMIRDLGAEIEITTVEKRFEVAKEIADKEGMTFIHPFDDLDVSEGQGTIAVEILNKMDHLKMIVPIGGGGLISGIAMYTKGVTRWSKVIGVEPENVARYTLSLEEGQPSEVKRGETLADGLLSVKPGDHVFPIVRDLVDDVVTCQDKYLKKALDLLYNKEKLIVEPSSAIGLGAILEGKIEYDDRDKLVLIITGGNVEGSKIEEIINS
ncbi:threonine/serine dehydratase [Peptoniphilus harei]|uniref:threonine ammonia-lyase n=1 Tax=Peptoniphilus harei TaxID=54005 RepID=A0A2X1ZPX1_9FIRM|nr:threonine/serine dehydratase [Peptoniphilus harei]MDU6742723.1 threonine/serine dehydratase [Peptoniphilus harei]QQT91472.1 threonine/serine dehydratase [Peptoniphilus harei]SPY46425.1 L-threonine dehydratase catabolic TdcB [Peptoniphilus harei]